MLGVRVGFDGLTVDPCIPGEWPGFEVSRQWRSAAYHILVENHDGVEKGVKTVMLNGNPTSFPIPPQPVGSVNEVVVQMGTA
jgi:N,N'-diacetylchitobiose phosphorylase